MASIGAYSFTTWKGFVPRASIASRTFRRPGVDGVGVLFGRWATPPVDITTTAYAANLAAANALIEGYRSLVKAAALVTVVDPQGNSWPNVCAMDVRAVPTVVVSPVASHLVTATWSLLFDTVVPA